MLISRVVGSIRLLWRPLALVIPCPAATDDLGVPCCPDRKTIFASLAKSTAPREILRILSPRGSLALSVADTCAITIRLGDVIAIPPRNHSQKLAWLWRQSSRKLFRSFPEFPVLRALSRPYIPLGLISLELPNYASFESRKQVRAANKTAVYGDIKIWI